MTPWYQSWTVADRTHDAVSVESNFSSFLLVLCVVGLGTKFEIYLMFRLQVIARHFIKIYGGRKQKVHIRWYLSWFLFRYNIDRQTYSIYRTMYTRYASRCKMFRTVWVFWRNMMVHRNNGMILYICNAYSSRLVWQYSSLFRPGRSTKYCEQRVCMSVCLLACVF